jgi:hypothetical protein
VLLHRYGLSLHSTLLSTFDTPGNASVYHSHEHHLTAYCHVVGYQPHAGGVVKMKSGGSKADDDGEEDSAADDGKDGGDRRPPPPAPPSRPHNPLQDDGLEETENPASQMDVESNSYEF